MNFVLVPADKAANNVIVVCRLYYINTLKRELVDTNAYKLQPSLSIVERYMRDPVKTYFGLLKIQLKISDKLKARDFNVTSLSTYDFLLFTLLYLII